jgi:flagellar basal body-associated protein FliL
MTKTALWIVIVVIVIVVAGGIWWSMNSNTGTGTVAQNTNNGAAAQPSGNSDQAIDQEMASINAQMNGLSSDSASVNQGLSDQPVQQSQF